MDPVSTSDGHTYERSASKSSAGLKTLSQPGQERHPSAHSRFLSRAPAPRSLCLAVVRWLAQKKTSPLTGAPLRTSVLVPNIALRKLIEEYKAKHGPHPD